MKKLRFLLSLTNDDNDYQIEQASAARRAAVKLGIDLEIVHAKNDGIVQSQQLLTSIQSSTIPRPDAILFEPAGSTTLPQVARAAAAAWSSTYKAQAKAQPPSSVSSARSKPNPKPRSCGFSRRNGLRRARSRRSARGSVFLPRVITRSWRFAHRTIL